MTVSPAFYKNLRNEPPLAPPAPSASGNSLNVAHACSRLGSMALFNGESPGLAYSPVSGKRLESGLARMIGRPKINSNLERRHDLQSPDL